MKCNVSGSLGIDCGHVLAMSFVAEKMCLTGFFKNLCIHQDKSVRDSKISSSDKFASFAIFNLLSSNFVYAFFP